MTARTENFHKTQIERGHGSLFNSTNESVAAIKNDPDRPREPPPPATPLDFPCCKPNRVLRPDLDDNCSLRKTFTNILRTGPGVKHIEALNVTLTAEVSLEEIIPTDFIPPLSWKHDPGTDESANGVSIEPSQSHKLSNGAPMPGRGKFFESVKELSYDNEDAFRAIRRDPPRSGHRPPRLVHFRKFWDSLSIMAEYWDTSIDTYVEKKEDKENDRAAMDVDDLRSEAQKFADEMLKKPAKAEKKMMYTGRRTETGRNMPGNFREDTVCAFVETLSWTFRCRLEHPKMQPRVKLQGMVLPLPHAVSVYRQPQDRLHAKAGILEGPLMGVFCRDQVCFRKAEEKVGEGKTEILDLLRETGLILMLAQKRAREGKQEEIPGEGKWWAHAPRWGGGPGGEIGIAAEEETIEDAEGSSEGQRKRVKKGSKADAWRTVRPPSATWEKNITYLQIGKDKKTEYDDIYLISSINHHISIIHARVPLAYIDFINESISNPNNPSQTNSSSAHTIREEGLWCGLHLQRTKWFDLLVAEDRIEAMRGIWGILTLLMRDGNDGDDGDSGEKEASSATDNKDDRGGGGGDVVMDQGI